MTLHVETPLLESRPLSVIAGRPVWLELDALQPSGSFKLRGVGRACETHAARGARRFVSSSGGNAGLAVAYAGRLLDVPVTVVVPETTPKRAMELLRLEDAEVIVHGASWQEANEFARSIIGPADACIHPFDDLLLGEGHATLVDEVVRAGLRPDAVVLSVGGGGLLSGVVEGLRRNGWSDVPVVAVETTGGASFHEAVKAERTVELAQIRASLPRGREARLRAGAAVLEAAPDAQRGGVGPERAVRLRALPRGPPDPSSRRAARASPWFMRTRPSSCVRHPLDRRVWRSHLHDRSDQGVGEEAGVAVPGRRRGLRLRPREGRAGSETSGDSVGRGGRP